MKSLDNKVAIITGSSKGIGAEIARQFAAQGAKVVINYASSEAPAQTLVEEITKNGGEAIHIKADVSNPLEVKNLFDQSINAFGKVDILVNNAGIMINSPLAQATDEEFEKQFNINVKGVFNTLREAATKLADNGSIVNISSSVSRTMFPAYGIYSASKAAVEQFAKVLAKEIGHRGINVNSVLPGPTATDLFLKGKPQELIDKLASANAFNRLGTPEDIAQVVVYLASDQAKWISGQSIGANGAMV